MWFLKDDSRLRNWRCRINSCDVISIVHGSERLTVPHAEVVHWHAQLSTELGACLRAFVGAEQSASVMQLEVWSRVLGNSVSVSSNRLHVAATAVTS